MKEDTTLCGRTFEHDTHLYATKKGSAVCDGVLRSKKDHASNVRKTR